MAIEYTKNSNKCVQGRLRDSIAEVAQAYCESGLLHIGYALRINDIRESQYVPALDGLPTLVICSVGDKVVDVRSIYDTNHEEVTALKTTLGL